MKQSSIFIKSVFIISLSMRFVLCIVNREANDDHMEAINWIADKHEIPQSSDCAECFQPKLFYIMNAGLIELLHINNRNDRTICVQLVNLVFSFFILMFTWKFIKSQNFNWRIKQMSFAFLAFNPCLTGINAQVTNDTFVILSGVMCIYFTDRLLKEKKLPVAIWLGAFVVLSSVIKGSGLLIFISLAIILIFKIISSEVEDRNFFARTLLAISFAYILIVPFAGGYYHSYIHHGTPFLTGMGPTTEHKKNEPVFRYRPGITSIAGGYLTFRYIGLIEQPYITNDPNNYPLHRTSVWSQLYGRTFFMHFDQHPPSWQSKESSILIAGRLMLALSVIPVFIFLLGAGNFIIDFIKNIFHDFRNYLNHNNSWIHMVFISVYLAFIVKYTLDLPDFSTMKSIFLFPAIPSFLKIFADGCALIKSNLLNYAFYIIITSLVLLSIYDEGFLALQLMNSLSTIA